MQIGSLLLGSLLCLSTWALALPSPKDIEASVQAGQFDRAESQLREVLREKPSSARAQYELGQVLAREGRYLEAEQALRGLGLLANVAFTTGGLGQHSVDDLQRLLAGKTVGLAPHGCRSAPRSWPTCSKPPVSTAC